MELVVSSPCIKCLIAAAISSIVLLLSSSQAFGAQPVPDVARPNLQDAYTFQQGWAVSGSLFPGIALHGFGHWLLDEEDTGYRLLIAEGIGLSALVGGFAGLAVTGAADEFVVPFTWATIGGAGLFVSSFLADVYGVSFAQGAIGSPWKFTPDLDLKAGYQNVHNPALTEATHFADAGLVWRFSQFALDGRFRKAFDGDNHRIETGLAWQLIGATPDEASERGHSLDIRLGYLHHRWGDFGVWDNFFESEVRTRIDLRWLGRTLEGSFFNAHAGIAVGSYSYDIPDIASDSNLLLLGGFGYGFYLTDDPESWGEVEVFYDHRHDGFVSGLKMGGLGSGPAGHLGLRADYEIWGGIGLEASFAAGSSYTTNIGLLYRYGGER